MGQLIKLKLMIDNSNDGDYNNHKSIQNKFNVFDIHDGHTIKLNKLLNYYIVYLRNDSAKMI